MFFHTSVFLNVICEFSAGKFRKISDCHSTTGTDRCKSTSTYRFTTSYNFCLISCKSRNKTSKQKPNKNEQGLWFSLFCIYFFLIWTVEKTHTLLTAATQVGTDGGCFGLIAALTLGTAAGETGGAGAGGGVEGVNMSTKIRNLGIRRIYL